ncbi:hypothetical protein LCGC14_1077610 [marine sediment metagenome]|uniref:Nucleoside 2-deoxyribosyltransferase n=1 Tax=marine sediment metagenome TaxID=412755 RepID=A0A0F9MGA9_9ZZZZ
MSRPTIYLAGPIMGENYDGAVNWRDQFQVAVGPGITCFSPMRGKKYLVDQSEIADSYEDTAMSCARGITTRDYFDVSRTDAIVANFLGAKKVSIGTVLELGFAHALRKPIILVLDDDNIHSHSMVQHIAGFIVSSLEEAAQITRALLLP